MKLLVTAPAYWATEAIARQRVWLYLRSAAWAGVEPHLFGIGTEHYQGESPMHLDGQIENLKAAKGYTHVLFTHAWDELFTAKIDEILCKYRDFGSPECLTAAGWDNLNVHPRNRYDAYYDTSKAYPYYGLSAYLAEIPWMLAVLERMRADDPEWPYKTHDITPSIMKGIVQGWYRPVVDYGCQVFQDKTDNCSLRNGRVFNVVTQSYPCLLHISGGYMDPETGRDEQIKPWAAGLGII